MSLLRRRMMQSAGESFPRERIVFSHADDEVVAGGAKKGNGDTICGIVIIHQSYYGSPYRPYWLYLLLLTKSGYNADAVRLYNMPVSSRVGNMSTGADGWLTGSDGLLHQRSTTNWSMSFQTLEEGLAMANEININNLPILNELTGKAYEGEFASSGGAFICPEAEVDLLDYYYGVI